MKVILRKKMIYQEKGLSLIEVIVAVVFSIIAIGSLIALSVVTIRTSEQARNRSQAVEFAKEGLEAIRIIRDNVSLSQNQEFVVYDPGAVACQSGGVPIYYPWIWVAHGSCPWDGTTYVLGSSNNKWNLMAVDEGVDGNFDSNYQLAAPYDAFYRKIEVTEGPSLDGTDKQVTVTVSWRGRDQVHEIVEHSVFTNWK